MMVPKIIFKDMSLEDNIDIIKWAFYDNNDSLDIFGYTIYYFPELASIDKNMNKEDVYKIIEKVVTERYNSSRKDISMEVERYNNIWKEYNDLYFSSLIKYLNIEWPKDKMVIEATVGMIPIFPRYLNDFSFSISPFVDDKKLIEVCAHESLHFLWFEKWKELYPDCPSKEFDSPYLPWKYSEMVTDPILNSSDIKNVINVDEKSYDSFYSLNYNGNNVMVELCNIYSKDISIEEKIKEGYTYIRKVNNR